jgi:hypothetical protein
VRDRPTGRQEGGEVDDVVVAAGAGRQHVTEAAAVVRAVGQRLRALLREEVRELGGGWRGSGQDEGCREQGGGAHRKDATAAVEPFALVSGARYA